MSIFDSSLLAASITAFYDLNIHHFDMNIHSHASCEIMYVKKGFCIIETATEQRTLYEGDFIFLDSFAPHRLIIETKTSCSLLNLEFSISANGLIPLNDLREYTDIFNKNEALPNNYLFCRDNRKLKQPLESLIQVLIKSNVQTTIPEDDYWIILLFQQLLLELSFFLKSAKQNIKSPYLEKAINYIHQNLQEDLRVPHIAKHVGINKSYLHLLFNQQLDISISSYINRKRLEQACFLLCNSDLSITEIAFEVGYNSRQHFSSRFSQYYHLSPQAYKKQKTILK